MFFVTVVNHMSQFMDILNKGKSAIFAIFNVFFAFNGALIELI